jgi:glycosyltransferase involved in cell wall biosynthesis
MKLRSPSEQPWLSVAMPVHGGERWLEATLSSVAGQDCTGIELVILDSSPDDDCGTIAKSFADRLQIRYEHMPNMTSWTAKTNLAVERAKAPHVSILHQDDLWLPERAEAMRDAIAAFPSAALLLNPSYIVDECGRKLGLWRCPLPHDRLLSAAEVIEPLLVQNFIAMPAPVIRRADWLAVRGMDEELWYTPDWDLYLKLARAGRTVYRRSASTAFRIHGTSLTIAGSRDRCDFEAQLNLVLDRHLDQIPATQRAEIRRRAAASITVNCDLARAAAGNAGALLRACATVLLLGPREAIRYLRDSRIIERALPRLRARLAGSF